MNAPWTNAERAALARLKKPEQIQKFLDEGIGYNLEPDRETCYSPRLVLRHGVAHCMEGALLAAAALRFHGHPPLLMDLESVRDDDHVLAVFQDRGHWGAVAKSNYAGLRFREPVYRTLRELAMSYFEHYYNLKGEKTLRAYSRPMNLATVDRKGWMTSEQDVWYIPEMLCEIRHWKVLPAHKERTRMWMDARLKAAGELGKSH